MTKTPLRKAVEPCIYLCENGRFLVAVSSEGVRRARAAATLAEARKTREQLRRDIRRQQRQQQQRQQEAKEREQEREREQRAVSAPSWPLGYAVERCAAVRWREGGYEDRTRSSLRDIIEFLGKDTPLASITLSRIDELIDTFHARGLRPATINRKLCSLSAILSTAHQRGGLETMLRLPRLRTQEHRIRFLSDTEERALISTLVRMGYREQAAAVKVLIYTGIRRGELFRLDCKDIDLQRHTLTVWQSKSRKPRTVPIAPAIRPLVAALYKLRKGVGPVFPRGHFWLHYAWERVRIELGYADDPEWVLHMLRHTCASRLARRGVSLALVKEWLGHSNVKTTMRYVHFAPSDLQEAAEKAFGYDASAAVANDSDEI
ncbi:site-specific integrase [Desulfovibrio piger]|nr:site-specific integrase [Desulfovibrio piger]